MVNKTNLQIASAICDALGISPHSCHVVEIPHEELDKSSGVSRKWTTRHDVTRAEQLATVLEQSGMLSSPESLTSTKGSK